MKRELIENLTVENDEYICHITKKELSDTEAEIKEIQRFFDKIKIVRKSDKKTLLSFKGEGDSQAFVDICQKIMSISGQSYHQPFQYAVPNNDAPVVPFSATNPEMYIHQGQAPTQTIGSNGLPTPKKVNVFEVKEEPNGVTAIVQVNKAEQEAQELARAQAALERKGEASGEDLLKQMAKDFKSLTEDQLPPEKKKALEEKKKKFPGFFNNAKK